jgi:hypothetical protein
MSMDRLSAIFCGETIFRGAEGHLLTARTTVARGNNMAIEKMILSRTLMASPNAMRH